MRLKEKVSNDSGRNNIPLRLLPNGMPFCSKDYIVGAVVVRSLTQSQILDPRRAESREGRRFDDPHHGLLSNWISETE